MTELPGACDSSDIDGNAILVGCDDIGYDEYVFISRFEIINSCTEDKNIDFKSFMVTM